MCPLHDLINGQSYTLIVGLSVPFCCLCCRTMTSKWRTFKTRSLEEDTVVFLWDILYQVCALGTRGPGGGGGAWCIRKGGGVVGSPPGISILLGRFDPGLCRVPQEHCDPASARLWLQMEGGLQFLLCLGLSSCHPEHKGHLPEGSHARTHECTGGGGGITVLPNIPGPGRV
jgi:hypothetical protein